MPSTDVNTGLTQTYSQLATTPNPKAQEGMRERKTGWIKWNQHLLYFQIQGYLCHWSIFPKFQCDRLYSIFCAKGYRTWYKLSGKQEMQYPASLQDSSLWWLRAVGSHRHLPCNAMLAPSPVMDHLWHLWGTETSAVHCSCSGISSTQMEMGSARHTQQPGSNRSYLLSQQASETGTTAISLSSPARRTDGLRETDRKT